MNNAEQYVLLWSARQNALHVETLDRMLASNRSACADGRACDYIVLLIGARAEVEAGAEKLRATLIERERRRKATDWPLPAMRADSDMGVTA